MFEFQNGTDQTMRTTPMILKGSSHWLCRTGRRSALFTSSRHFLAGSGGGAVPGLARQIYTRETIRLRRATGKVAKELKKCYNNSGEGKGN